MLYSAAMTQEPPSGHPAGQPAPAAPHAYPVQPAWEQPQPPREKAGWGGTLGVMGVLLFVTFGGFLFGGAGAGQLGGGVGLGQPVPVASGVTMRLAEGWSVTDTLADPPGIILTGPGGNVLAAAPGAGSVAETLELYVERILRPEARQLSLGEPAPIDLPSGDAAILPYVGVFREVVTPLEGEVTAVATPSGVGVVVDGWAPEGTYVTIREQVVAMAGTVEAG